MSFSLVYAKTARGVVEIGARTNSLSPSARRVLILVDGKRTEAELARVVKEGELQPIIVTLLGLAMIEEVGLTDLPDDSPAWTATDNTVPMGPGDLDIDLRLNAVSGPAPTSPVPAPAPTPALRKEFRPAPAAAPAPPVGYAATPAGTARASAAQDATAAALEEIKRMAVSALFERIGPYGEDPAARIQDCKTKDALRDQIRQASYRIRTFKGESAARDYLATMGLAQ